MKLISVWTTIVSFFDVITLQPSNVDDQITLPHVIDTDVSPISVPVGHPHAKPSEPEIVTLSEGRDDGKVYMLEDGTPIVVTPQHVDEPLERLNCQYPEMPDYESCHGPNSRGCWLRNKRNGSKIDINTNYEDESKIPIGITRKYILDVGEEPISPDRMTMEHGKVFNRTYPGPWLRACWGDTIEVEVRNGLRWNGTSIHWHGFRQLRNSHMDGVNGITECPIAPGDSYTYRFKAMQYGSAWYHSHYGLQYGDGLLGPITIHGPETANFSSDHLYRPILMTDWNHRSVFEDWPLELVTGNAPEMTNILLNGTGQFGPGSKVEDKYQLNFTAGYDHKLILINTAVDTGFAFSIDHHKFTVIEMDFVPIKPYTTTSIKIGIGQRYHIIVHGKKDPYDQERDGNYWMRTIPMRKCNKFSYGPDEQSGIIRYNPNEPRNKASLSEPEVGIDISCGDENMKNLIPWKGWRVQNPINIDPHRDHETLPNNSKYIFEVRMENSSGAPYEPSDRRLRWSMHQQPFRINFSEPTLLNLDNSQSLMEKPYLDIVTFDENTSDKWVWMVLTARAIPAGGGEKAFFPAAHPMHLHGHDFALLYQSSYPWDDDPEHPGGALPGFKHQFTPDKLHCGNDYINCDNPTRRDVVLLPAGGFVIIAFKADNPGAWIFHCHIAFHASSGLAIQIIENKNRIWRSISAEDKAAVERRCRNWDHWFSNPMNLWDYHDVKGFQDDSGV